MAYIDQATLAADVTFRARVRMAMMTAAVQISAEALGQEDPNVYGKRQTLTGVVLLGSGGNYLDAFAWAVAQNATITGASLDSDIQFQVNAVWNALAGVRAATD